MPSFSMTAHSNPSTKPCSFSIASSIGLPSSPSRTSASAPSLTLDRAYKAGVSDRVLEGSEADFAGGARGQEDALDKPDIIDGGARDYPARGRDVWNEAPLLGRDAALLIICANRYVACV